jgi:hypothetical protein
MANHISVMAMSAASQAMAKIISGIINGIISAKMANQWRQLA